MKVAQLLGLWGPCVQGHGLPLLQELWPIRVYFFEPLVAGNQKASLASLSPIPPVQALRGLPCLGSFTVIWPVRHIEGATLAGVLLCRLARQALKGAP